MKTENQKLYRELADIAERDRVSINTVEQDYALSYVLIGISEHDELSKRLVFRGGTALQKCYFEHRYSKDLDFSVLGELKIDQYNKWLEEAAARSEELFRQVHPGLNCSVSVKMLRERNLDTNSLDSHKVYIKLPWHLEHKSGRAGRTIKLDTNHDEPVLLKPERREIAHPYEREMRGSVQCLSLDELIAEKWVAICDTSNRIADGLREFSRPKDFYDLHHALNKCEVGDVANVLAVAVVKSDWRNVELVPLDRIATAEIERDWNSFLRDAVPGELPAVKTVLDELQAKITSMYPDFSRCVSDCSDRVSALRASLIEVNLGRSTEGQNERCSKKDDK